MPEKFASTRSRAGERESEVPSIGAKLRSPLRWGKRTEGHGRDRVPPDGKGGPYRRGGSLAASLELGRPKGVDHGHPGREPGVEPLDQGDDALVAYPPS